MKSYLPDGCPPNPYDDCECGEPMCDASCEHEDDDDSDDCEPEE
jgi:hypothetical protein